MNVTGRILVYAAVAASAILVPVRGRAQSGAGHYIVVLDDAVENPKHVAVRQAIAHHGRVTNIFRHALKGYAVTLPPSRVDELRAEPRVRFVSEDRDVSAFACTDPPSCQVLPTGIQRIAADQSSALSGNGTGSVDINVAVIDTGIDTDHPDLNVVGGIDCTRGRRQGHVGLRWVDDPEGHGTHVAGIIAARDNSLGVVGVVPGANLWAVRVLNRRGKGRTSQVICGIDFVTSTRTDADPTNDIAVANMSIGDPNGSDDRDCGRTDGDAEHLAICNSVAAGVTYVAAAGNSLRSLAGTVPATYDEVLTVTNVVDTDGLPGGLSSTICDGDDDSAAVDSNFVNGPADMGHVIAAPGSCILSTYPLDRTASGYRELTGTSMASPHVAVVAALCIASGACADLTPAQIVQKLRADAEAYSKANPGYGFIGDPLHQGTGPAYGYLTRANY